jgi:hypothetical protein
MHTNYDRVEEAVTITLLSTRVTNIDLHSRRAGYNDTLSPNFIPIPQKP